MSDNEDVGNPYRHMSFYRDPPEYYITRKRKLTDEAKQLDALDFLITRSEWDAIRHSSYFQFAVWFNKKCLDFLASADDEDSEAEEPVVEDSGAADLELNDADVSASPVVNAVESKSL